MAKYDRPMARSSNIPSTETWPWLPYARSDTHSLETIRSESQFSWSLLVNILSLDGADCPITNYLAGTIVGPDPANYCHSANNNKCQMLPKLYFTNKM